MYSGKLCGFAYLDRKLCALLLCISVGITLSVVLIGLCNARRIRTVRYTVKLPVKKACKAVFFSDLHLGAFCSLGHVQKVVDTIQKEAPELILFGGDLWDMDLTSQKKCDRYAEMLASLGGILGCEGNHDLFTREDKQKNAFLEKANICIPGDTPVTHPQTQLKIYARKSCRSARAALLPTVDILLDHEPKMAEQAISFGIPLVLCGHTHRGQTFPGNILRSLSTPYFYGLHKKAKSTVITTAGCGSTGLALRFGTTGEIVSIQIEPM